MAEVVETGSSDRVATSIIAQPEMVREGRKLTKNGDYAIRKMQKEIFHKILCISHYFNMGIFHGGGGSHDSVAVTTLIAPCLTSYIYNI